jgi:hypothetical protein
MPFAVSTETFLSACVGRQPKFGTFLKIVVNPENATVSYGETHATRPWWVAVSSRGPYRQS